MSGWNILYRGPLSSCNYDCGYCPFAKTTNTRAELQTDQRQLDRFVEWAAAQARPLGILITPWGEALVHAYYRRAMAELSQLTYVHRIAIQTNLSGPLDGLEDANRRTLALWTTFHPSQTSVARFVTRCRELDSAGIRYSVGAVGFREHFEAIEELRRALDPKVYLWINADERVPNYYQPGEIERLLAVDPYFHWNLHHYPSHGKPCAAGETTFTVDGNGNIRRCHFINEILGDIYKPGFETCLKPRACTAASCDCYIGYIHRPQLKMDQLYGDGLLERIPRRWPAVIPEFAAATRAPRFQGCTATA
jgi:MoaA/NifB/PqqE/SkfB family radical SAM enzyme